MARDKTGRPDPATWLAADFSSAPLWPTTKGKVYPGGILVQADPTGKNRTIAVWMYRLVPMAPVVDARSTADLHDAAAPLAALADELALSTPVTMANRRMSAGNYRDIHLLGLNIPQYYTPPADHPLREFLRNNFRTADVPRRMLLVGVRARPRLTMDAGLRGVVDSVVDTFVGGSAPMSDFAADLAMLDTIMARAGMVTPERADINLGDAWWTYGKSPDTYFLSHPGHLHFFANFDAVRRAGDIGLPDCDRWTPETVPGEAAITFASVSEFDYNFMSKTSARAAWAAQLFAAGALAISVRARIEPTKVTRAELRRQRKRYGDDIRERAKAGKMELYEQEEMRALLAGVEAVYASSDAPVTFHDTSVLIAFNGVVDDLATLANRTGVPLSMAPMEHRQRAALAEALLCSPARANPNVSDLPADAISYAGLESRSGVGDETGALLGFTERDRQPAYVSPAAASKADSLPMMGIFGSTGSGKAISVLTKVPTPSGWTTMGRLGVGDAVLGRDGRPCPVTFLSDVIDEPDLYRVTFGDGQQVLADANHQWLVSDFAGRVRARSAKHLAAIDHHRAGHALADRLEALARDADPDATCDIDELFASVSGLEGIPWHDAHYLGASLRFVDCPRVEVVRTLTTTVSTDRLVKSDPAKLWNVRDFLTANIERWSNVTGSNAARWAATTKARRAAAEAMLERTGGDEQATAPQIVRTMTGASNTTLSGAMTKVARQAGLAPVDGRATTVVPLPPTRTITRTRSGYRTREALAHLAIRLRQMYADAPSADPDMRVVSVAEMLAEGLRTRQRQARFAVPVAAALDLPEADLPLDPYVLGAWLGDGSAHSGTIVSPDRLIIDRIEQAGYPVISSKVGNDDPVSGWSVYRFGALASRLRAVLKPVEPTKGPKLDKRIPVDYLRASAGQRLALLQGLMDTDGTIDVNGACELSLSKADLAADALELIRSLGIKASVTVGPAGYRDPVRGYVAGEDRHRIHFTTDRPVFFLPRKAARLPEPGTLRQTSRWNYITSIEPVRPGDPDYGPARCISVDSPDHTYLVEGFVATHNTFAAQWLAYQFSKIVNDDARATPVVFINPKQEDDLSSVVIEADGQVVNLDTLTGADGVFDPMRFSADPEMGVTLASSMLMTINPWAGMRDAYEAPLLKALSFGVSHGAACTGQALDIARAGLPDLPADMFEAVDSVIDSAPEARSLIGRDPHSEALRVADGLTLIQVGKRDLALPDPNNPDPVLTERVGLARLKMMVYGSASALTGRQGVVFFDEAWVFLGAGRSEMERLGRLARSQQVLPVLLTQRISDAVDAGMTNYISRGVILGINDPGEARAACELFGLEPTPSRLGRITAKGVRGQGGEAAPNWNSMRALREPGTKKMLRGSIGIYVDLAGRAVPTEISVPEWFGRLASTNPDDVRARKAAQRPGDGGQR